MLPDRRAGGCPAANGARRGQDRRRLGAGHRRAVCGQRGHHRASSTIRAAIEKPSITPPAFRSQTRWETFDNSGPVRGREDVMVGDVLVNSSLARGVPPQPRVLPVGTLRGLVPYFFPGVLALAAVPGVAAKDRRGNGWWWRPSPWPCVMHLVRLSLHLQRRGRTGGQPLLHRVLSVVSAAHAGDGRPGQRMAAGSSVGALFTSQPGAESIFLRRRNPGEHAKSGPAADACPSI